MNRRVLVTDGEHRSALAITRSLGRAGCTVLNCAEHTPSLAAASRWSRGEARVPSPLEQPDAFAEEVAALARRWDIDTVVPATDESLLALIPHRALLSGICLPFADLDTFLAISDKRRLLDVAAGLGLATPAQWVLETRAAAITLDPTGLAFPLVLKPARSVAGAGARVKLSVRHARDAAALREVLEELPAEAYPLLVQQRIEGPGTGVFLLIWDDEMRAVFAHRRLREKPPAGGVSVRCESVAADSDLVAAAARLLRCFGWRGVAMVEFKVDAATGTPYLMEVNGRFWGSLQLAIDAGVDFPALLLAAALGERHPPVTSYRIGLRSHWWLGELDHVIARLRRSNTTLNLPPGSPSRLRALTELITSWRPGQSHDTLRLDDARPFLREIRQWVAAL